MDVCHLKNSELEKKHQKKKGRVVFRGDIVKDDSGSNAVFTEQGSSASQRTAAKVVDIMVAQDKQRTQYLLTLKSRWKMLQNCWKFKNRNVQTYGYVYHDTNGLKSIMEDPVVSLERNLYGHPLAGLLWEEQFEKILLEHGWRNVPNWVCLSVHRHQGPFLSVYVDDINMAGKKYDLEAT